MILNLGLNLGLVLGLVPLLMSTPLALAQSNPLGFPRPASTASQSSQKLALAADFAHRQQEYLAKARAEQRVLDQRLAASYVFPKTPTPIDTARNLLRYYRNQAARYGAKARRLSAPGSIFQQNERDRRGVNQSR